jgi:hypothetical protein
MLKKIGKRYALVSVKDPTKVLKWFGTKKPSSEAKDKVEKRVQYFKNQAKYKKDHGKEPSW